MAKRNYQRAEASHFVAPKLVVNGNDVTPLPLLPELPNTTTIDDVGGLAFGAGESACVSHSTIPWLVNVSQRETDVNHFATGHNAVDHSERLIEQRQGEQEHKTATVSKEFSLKETPTKTLLCMVGSSVCSDDPTYNNPRDRNSANTNSIINRDKEYGTCHRGAQTFHNSQKTTATMALPGATLDVGCVAAPSKIQVEEMRDDTSCLEAFVESITLASSASVGCLLDVSEGITERECIEVIANKQIDSTVRSADEFCALYRRTAVLRKNELYRHLLLMERALQQNCHHQEQLRYRGVPCGNNAGILVSCGKKTVAKDVDHLFAFKCTMTKARAVTSMDWNKDVLAVGYDVCTISGLDEKGDGLVLLWSLRNNSYPEKVLRTSSGVTDVSFSTTRATTLAVAMKDGNICVYDTCSIYNEPILDSAFVAGRHMCAIWQIRWVDKGPDKSERLVSIGSDGRVLEWSTQKGLVASTLMVLKRVGSGNSNGISQYAAGLGLDFPKDNSTNYIVGTDEGAILRCSVSYNEQHLDTYQGHDGPVNRIRCSPFVPEVFLSCSADWTVKVWSIKDPKPKFTLHSIDLSAQVHDIAWSPDVSTVFSLVTGDGRVEVWDLSNSTSDPLTTRFAEESDRDEKFERRTIRFSDKAPIMVVGNDFGDTDVFEIGGLLDAKIKQLSRDKQQARLMSLFDTS